MKIGINLLYLIPGHIGGTETYAKELIPYLAKEHELIIFCGKETTSLFSGMANVRVVTLPFFSANRVIRIILEQTLLPLLASIQRVSVLFSLGYSAPLIHAMPSVVTIHDLNWYYHPEDFGLIARYMWILLTIMSAKYSDHIITVSDSSAKSIIEILKEKASKVTSILHGTPAVSDISKTSIKSPFILTVVAGYPHKNLKTLLRAFAVISKQYSGLKLVVCGLGGRAMSDNMRLIKELGIESQVNILGYVTRAELADLYSRAEIFVFPSAYEGFGIPVIEAMSYGAPVVSSNAFSLAEVVGKAGLLVDPFDIPAYIESIESILQSPKLSQDLIKRGKKRVSELNWEKTGRDTISILERIGGLK